jgi:hypothetical protein
MNNKRKMKKKKRKIQIKGKPQGFFFFFNCLFICVYIVWAISLPCPPFPPTPSLPGRSRSALLFSNFVEEKTLKIIRKA